MVARAIVVFGGRGHHTKSCVALVDLSLLRAWGLGPMSTAKLQRGDAEMEGRVRWHVGGKCLADTADTWSRASWSTCGPSWNRDWEGLVLGWVGCW
jgi:hypothetical protein